MPKFNRFVRINSVPNTSKIMYVYGFFDDSSKTLSTVLYYCTKKTLIGLVIRNVIYSRDASLEIPRIYIGMEHEYLLYVLH